MRYEEIFTDNYRLMDEEQKSHLMKFSDEEYGKKDTFYTRVWTRPITTYAKNYSKFDVSLAPIKDTMFNRMKSQLKVIEAGFYKKAIIASDIGHRLSQGASGRLFCVTDSVSLLPRDASPPRG